MDVPSIPKLCLKLISSAFQRCRLSEVHCRLSVALDSYKDIDPPIVRISNTGIGSCLEEFQDLKYAEEFGSVEWDGVLWVKTTDFSDDEVYNYQINLKDSISSRRLTRLPSQTKNGAKFRGTEVCLSISESAVVLLEEISCFFQKMLILQISNVAMDLMVKQGALPSSQYENVFLANKCTVPCSAASNVERLKPGFEDYVLKHGNTLDDKCDSCFTSREHLKVGTGEACRAAGQKNAETVMEAVIIISELSESTSFCSRSCNGKTEVLYFEDFSPSSIPRSSLNALTSIDWKSYGLTLVSAKDQAHHTSLEWKNFPPYVQIDIVLHWYHNHVKLLARMKTQPGLNLTKKAVKRALDDLKEKHEGFLLSSHALKICSYVPDLARTIAGLVFSSKDSHFQQDCLSLLGMQSREVGDEVVEDCIKEKIISVIGMNDRKPRKSQVAAASYLFLNETAENPSFEDEEQEGECFFTFLD